MCYTHNPTCAEHKELKLSINKGWW